MVYVCKTTFSDTFVLGLFIWYLENELFKENVIFEHFSNRLQFYNFEVRTMFLIAFRISYSANFMDHILQFWNATGNMRRLLKINVEFQKQINEKNKPKIARCIP